MPSRISVGVQYVATLRRRTAELPLAVLRAGQAQHTELAEWLMRWQSFAIDHSWGSSVYRISLILLGLAATPLGAQELRFPSLDSYIEAMQEPDAKAAELDEFFYIRSLIGDFVAVCDEPHSQTDDGVVWGLSYLASMNQVNDLMMRSRWLLEVYWDDSMPERVPEVIARASRDLDSKWRALHAARDNLSAAGTCRERFIAIESFSEAFIAFERESRPYWNRVRMERAIARGATSRATPDPADMRAWREIDFELADVAAITDYAVAVLAGHGEPVSRDWALGEGSRNRFLLVTHPETRIEDVRQIAASLAPIEGPYSIRPAANPEAFGIATGEFKGFFSGQEFDGTGRLATIDKMVAAFGAVAERWRGAVYATE